MCSIVLYLLHHINYLFLTHTHTYTRSEEDARVHAASLQKKDAMEKQMLNDHAYQNARRLEVCVCVYERERECVCVYVCV
jgi:hypothetical protein